MEDSERLQKTLSELKATQARLDQLDQEQAALMEHLDSARRSQRRITYYLVALVVLCGLITAVAAYVLVRML
jgi:type VI protein secretion system component VasF